MHSRHISQTVRRAALGALLIHVIAGAESLHAQTASTDSVHRGPVTASGEPRVQVGVSFSVAQPLGAFHDNVKDGFGLGAHALYRFDAEGAFALRVDGGFVDYGDETVRLPLSTVPGGGRVRLNVTTSNDIFWLGVGPQLMRPRGRVRPYVNATAGFSLFATISSASGRSSGGSFADDMNYHDTRFSWGGGTGVLVPIRHGKRTLTFLDLGVRYHDNGREVRYLRKGGIRDLSDGSIAMDPIRGRADLITWHVGFSIGVR